MDLFKGMDWATYSTFHLLPHQLPALTGLMQVGNWLGSYLAVAILLVVAVIIIPQSGRLRMACAAALTFFGGFVLIEALNFATQRPRPPDAEDIVGAGAMTSSFPSREVFLAAFAWLMLAQAFERRYRRPGLRAAVYTMAILGIVFVCVSQLWFGLHWVTDVLAGLAGGLGLALVGRWGATPPTRGLR